MENLLIAIALEVMYVTVAPTYRPSLFVVGSAPWVVACHKVAAWKKGHPFVSLPTA